MTDPCPYCLDVPNLCGAWRPLRSESIDYPDSPPSWFVVRCDDDHDTYFDSEPAAQAEADRLNEDSDR